MILLILYLLFHFIIIIFHPALIEGKNISDILWVAHTPTPGLACVTRPTAVPSSGHLSLFFCCRKISHYILEDFQKITSFLQNSAAYSRMKIIYLGVKAKLVIYILHFGIEGENVHKDCLILIQLSRPLPLYIMSAVINNEMN